MALTLNLPSKYASSAPSSKSAPAGPSAAPTLEWLTATWTVTHSTLAMWRTARNVRITYKPLPSKGDGRPRLDDIVEYEPTNKSPGTLKSVEGIDTEAPASSAGTAPGCGSGWDWRGKGWLFFVGSHWEVLGWGEETRPDGEVERWAITWFAPTIFTKEGVDVYCDRKEGLSEATYEKIDKALKASEAKPVAEMVAQDMRAVEIKLPWTEK